MQDFSIQSQEASSSSPTYSNYKSLEVHIETYCAYQHIQHGPAHAQLSSLQE